MLNRALRTMDGDIMTRMGFFIDDLHRHIEEVHKEQYGSDSSAPVFTVYRGQGLSKADFDQVLQIRGGLMSFNSFISTSKRRSVSMVFAQGVTDNPDIMEILFVMKIDPAQSTTPFASIHDMSAIEDEDEVLFAMHSVFRVHDIKSIGDSGRLYEVHLSLTSENDRELRALTDRIREESYPDNEGWHRLALVLINMGQLEKAEEICRTLLGQATGESGKATVYSYLGLIEYNRGKHREAITFYDKGLAIAQQSLSPTDPELAASYNNIGNVYQSMGDYPKAHSSHEKALGIQQQSLPSTHPHLAMSYKNIGKVYYSTGDFPKALSSQEKALAIQQKSLPLTHPNLAMSYSNIGLIYENMKNYSKASSLSERAISIGQQSLPANHPDLKNYRNHLERIKDKM